MRVIAGRYRGRRLRTPRGHTTRPSAERVREALFSILGDMQELRVLDLFAGSGLLGIEALSRGARECVFVDFDPRAVSCIRANLGTVGEAQIVRQQDALEYLSDAGASGERPFDVVFVDPPYRLAAALVGPLCDKLPALATDHARIVFESDKRTKLEPTLTVIRDRVYGDTRITVCSVD